METITYWREPISIEIKWCWGAFHYREFPLELCLDENGKPMLSIISDLDGLRYYYTGIEYFSARKYKPRKISA